MYKRQVSPLPILTKLLENETFVFVVAIPFDVKAFIGRLFITLLSIVVQSYHVLSSFA